MLYKFLLFLKKLFPARSLFDSGMMVVRFAPLRKHFFRYDTSKKFFTLCLKCKEDIYKYLVYISLLLLLILMPLMSLEVGISDRELDQIEKAEKVYRYYSEGDNAIFEVSSLPYQGQIVDNITYALTQWLGIDDIFQFRHIVTSFFGWLTILITSLFLLRLFSWRAAFFGLLFLALSPRFTGHSFYSMVDIPLAFSYIWMIYQIYLFCLKLPVIKRSRVFLIICNLFLATSLSVSGYFLIFLFIFFVFLYFFFNNPVYHIFTGAYLKSLLKLFLVLFSISGIVYILGLIYLPIDLRTPFFNPAYAIDSLAFLIDDLPILFRGVRLEQTELPWYYLPYSMFITIPLAVLLGFLLHIVLLRFIFREKRVFVFLLLILALYFPLLSAIKAGIKPHGDWSMFLFLYPIMIVLAATGLESVLRKINDRYTNTVLIGFFLLLLCMPLRHTVVNRPVSYVYYNEISGGIDHAYGNYEMDFDDQINKKASEWAINKILSTADTLPGYIATNGNRGCAHFFEKHKNSVEFQYLSYQQQDTFPSWDYYIYFVNDDSRMLPLLFDQKKIIHQMNIEKTPIVLFFKSK